MLKKLIGFRTKYSLLLRLQKLKGLEYFKNTIIDQTKNQAYIFLAADYGNLGDVAITYAQTKFLKEHSDYQVIEIPISESLEGLWFVKEKIKSGDIVTTVGGGNMGDLYDQIEFIRQLTFSFFPNNKIISFPQTFDFAETKNGKRALNKAKKVYNSHKNLIVVAREQTSYELMQKHYTRAQVIKTPDIVLSLDESEPQRERKGVLVCMRQDAEKSLSETQNDFIIEKAKEHFGEPVFYDTHIGRNKMSIEEREEELYKIWTAFKSAELVITDRLHGMIFCHITETPALGFQNNNHKVRETYDWIKQGTSVNLHTSFTEEKIEKFFEEETFNKSVKRKNISNHYKDLIDVL